ncbi:NUDIX domain-containing protein [Brevibacterium litoralis]|uniref:NUDIX domain-containing protein n=1 Tax=Brevibacterium litoralis TaxID=3138935 RepID=UPI0032ECC729
MPEPTGPGHTVLRHRSIGPDHDTVSVLVVDATGTRVFLHRHRRAGTWGQFGGHPDPTDADHRAAAARELREEAGIAAPAGALRGPVEITDLPGFGACGTHRDHLYVFVHPSASPAAEAPAAGESRDLAWFPGHDLPADVMPDLQERIPRLLAGLGLPTGPDLPAGPD